MDSTIFPTPKLRVGVFPNPQGFELAFLDKQRQPHFYHLEHLEQLPVVLRQQFAEKIGKKQRFFYISCLEPHLLWQKHLLLPRVAVHERYRQVRMILKQQLPTDESQIQFDFISRPLPITSPSQRIDYVQIFVVKRKNVRQHCERFQPLKLNALDFYAHALLRAFCYSCNAPADQSTLFMYHNPQKDPSQSVLLQQYQDRLIQRYEKKLSLTALLQLFFQHAPEKQIKRCVIYAELAERQAASAVIPAHVELIEIAAEQYPYFIALGCALWKSESWQTGEFFDVN